MFNNPYNFYPYMNSNMLNTMPSNMIRNASMGIRPISKGGLFKSFSNIKWGNVLTNTQKTLNVINQAIPVYYQIKPIWGNLKSFGKIMSAFNEQDNNLNPAANFNNEKKKEETNKKEDVNTPTFFIN